MLVLLVGAGTAAASAALLAAHGGGRRAAPAARRPSRVLAQRRRPASALPGALLVADRGNNRIILVDAARKVRWLFPTRRDLRRGVHLNYNDDAFVAADGRHIVANEEDAHTIVSIDIRTHARAHLYGTPGVRGWSPGLLNTPDDAYPLANGQIVVADAYNCRVIWIRRHRIVRQIGQTHVCRHDPPATLADVNGDTPLPGGGVLVSEITGSWIDVFDARGRLRSSFRAPVRYPSDPQPLSGGRILLADYSRPGSLVVVSRDGRLLWRYRPVSGNGMLDHPSLALPLPNGDIAVNDDYRDRIVILDPATKRIVWQYGKTDVPGAGRNRLDTPDGMDFVPLDEHGHAEWGRVRHPAPVAPALALRVPNAGTPSG
ncbi:MAG TPA: PQQ-binding-like beta-propeller repeat protein [Gaiellaceae bacterium]|nr:PQQ-binding-like beta-propeller repeat protein [Gaiellaceae bacterium]